MAEAENPKPDAAHYDANYGNFESDLYSAIRREAYGEDIGQNSWLTANEQDRFLPYLTLSSGKELLDVGCGAGGPAIRIARQSGCSVVGIDVHAEAIAAAQSLAAKHGVGPRTRFLRVSASEPPPFADGAFDAITCIDAINHFPGRPAVVAAWARMLKPSSRLLFTDPITVTGPLSKDEIALRSSAGFFLFVPAGYDERVLAESGLRLLVREDATENMARIAEKRGQARSSREEVLRKIEGDVKYEQQQKFLDVAARMAAEGRLSRFLYVAEKPGPSLGTTKAIP